MKFCVFVSVQIFMVFAVCFSSAVGAGKQLQHVSYLTPFPRVGRSGANVDGGDLTWGVELGYPRGPNALYLNDDRIRRTGTKNMNTGLWFGPRLGRLQKRGDGYLDDPWNYIILRDVPNYRHTPKYTPRLGRESQENLEEGAENEDVQITSDNRA